MSPLSAPQMNTTTQLPLEATEIEAYMQTLGNEAQREVLMRYFKTGEGEYGAGDKFLGIRTPAVRQVARMARGLSLPQVERLLASPWHEVRMCGLVVLTDRFGQLSTKRMALHPDAIAERDSLVNFYLQHTTAANNWDLVDTSAPKVLGQWLLLPTAMEVHTDLNTNYKLRQIDRLSASRNLWEQRMSMVCTLAPTSAGDASWCQRYALRLLHHPHDLMHKAVGWMLREMGEKVDLELLRRFLDEHAHEMPRTTLRYAIEHLPTPERKEWMNRK